ncbi:hypothetical protein AtEden1_Chr3g0192781 [Arabidopsis thaliana]
MLDVGPAIASKRFQVDNVIKAPELLSFLFSEGDILILVPGLSVKVIWT